MDFRTAAGTLVLCATLLAGCSGDDEPAHDDHYTCPDGTEVDLSTVEGHDEEGFDPLSACPAPQKKTYSITFQAVRGHDGTPLPGAEVYAVPVSVLDPADPKTLGLGQYSDSTGRLTFQYDAPTEIWYQLLGPEPVRWTREGGRVMVGETVELVQGNHTLADRVLSVPVYLSEVEFQVDAAWGPANAVPQADPDAPVVPASKSFAVTGFLDPETGEPLNLTAGAAQEYWSRLVVADQLLAWTNEAPDYADLYAGWACGDDVFKATPDTTAGPTQPTGNWQAPSELDLAADDVPCAGGPVNVAALTDTLVLGQDMPLTFTGHLQFAGVVPSELPVPPGCGGSQIRCMGPTLHVPRLPVAVHG